MANLLSQRRYIISRWERTRWSRFMDHVWSTSGWSGTRLKTVLFESILAKRRTTDWLEPMSNLPAIASISSGFQIKWPLLIPASGDCAPRADVRSPGNLLRLADYPFKYRLPVNRSPYWGFLSICLPLHPILSAGHQCNSPAFIDTFCPDLQQALKFRFFISFHAHRRGLLLPYLNSKTKCSSFVIYNKFLL